MPGKLVRESTTAEDRQKARRLQERTAPTNAISKVPYLSQADQGEFIIPAMAAFKGAESLVYYANDTTDRAPVR